MCHKLFYRLIAGVALFTCAAVTAAWGQEPTPRAKNTDTVLPGSFELKLLQVRIDSPDRFAMRYAGGILAPTLTVDDGPIFVSGTIRLVGKWQQLGKGRNEELRKSELTLKFRAIPLIGVKDAFKAIREQDQKVVWLEKDPETGEQKMKWYVDAEDARATNDGSDKHGNWRKGESDQDYDFKLQFDLPRKKHDVDIDVPFEFVWYPDGQWTINRFYAIDVEHSTGVDIAKTALFHAAGKALKPERELRVAVYKMLTSLGIPLDPFWWLK